METFKIACEVPETKEYIEIAIDNAVTEGAITGWIQLVGPSGVYRLWGSPSSTEEETADD